LTRPPLDIPLGGVVCAVIHEEGEPACPAHDAGELPAADQCVLEMAGGPQESLSMSERKSPDVVGVDLVRGVKIRYAIQLVGHPAVQDLSLISSARSVEAFGLRSDVHRFGIGVAHVCLQARAKLLPIHHLECVIVGIANRSQE
jgi:hypothetical protein